MATAFWLQTTPTVVVTSTGSGSWARWKRAMLSAAARMASATPVLQLRPALNLVIAYSERISGKPVKLRGVAGEGCVAFYLDMLQNLLYSFFYVSVVWDIAGA